MGSNHGLPTLADDIIGFNSKLDFNGTLPYGIRIMNPFRENEHVMDVSSAFYRKYYNDRNSRHLILGINPGRFGAGLTGIPFTDPKHLTIKCSIPYPGPMAHEPSSVFFYDMIRAFGGEEAFYSRFYISAVCPLGFTKPSTNLSSIISENLSSSEGHESIFLSTQAQQMPQPNHQKSQPQPHKHQTPQSQTPKGTAYALGFVAGKREVNYNYYDSRELTAAVMDFIVECLQTQLSFGVERDVCFCLGTGKNEKFLNNLNKTYHFFERIVALEHPRYIMQYKAKTKEAYVKKYIRVLREI